MLKQKDKIEPEIETNELLDDTFENLLSNPPNQNVAMNLEDEECKNGNHINLCEHSAYVAEHKLYYEIYYEELKLFYQKTTIFTTIQLGLFTGVILKYEDLSSSPWLMSSCLLFLIVFSIFQLLVSIRGNHVNNAVIETIASFEKKTGFTFLNTFQTNVAKGNRIKKMNFPSLMIVGINILFIFVWLIIAMAFVKSIIPENAIHDLITSTTNTKKYISYLIPIFSCLFAVTMKIADLLDEHGLTLFKYADILFGVLWGIFGALLCLSHTIIANVIFAMMIGFVIRRRLDYINHIIAFLIITTVFFLSSDLIKPTYFAFLFTIIILGCIKDLKYKSHKTKISKIVEIVYLYVPLIYALPSLIYSIVFNDWMVFIAFFAYDFTYNITRLIVRRLPWYKEDNHT